MSVDIRGIFSLKQAYEEQISGNWVAAGSLPANNPVQVRPFGYFGGGDIDRIDYSNDTATASPKGSLSTSRSGLAATGNSFFGYFAGGGNLTTTVDRIDYSNDTSTASPKGPLSVGKYQFAATGNASFGYFGGGIYSYPAFNSTAVDRINYSNDTATASPKGPLSLARRDLAATGNSSFGYFGGGFPNDPSIERINYSNDTATASPKGSLSGIGPYSQSSYGLAATGNSSFGYFGGGRYLSGIQQYSTTARVNRIDYSNDTATSSVKGSLSLARYRLAATGNSSFGYFGGGGDLIIFSTVDRIDYSNDTATASVKGPLSSSKWLIAAASSLANGLTQ
jgi:hypothetical protein